MPRPFRLRPTAFAIAFGAAPLALGPAALSAEPVRYVIDPDHTTVAFLVSHVGYADLLGRFNDVSGSFVYDEETQELSDVMVVVETASIDTDHEARDQHVRGSDFLDAQAHPQMTFTADGGTAEGESEGTVEGELTLRGETRPLTLDVTLNKAAEYPFGHQQYTLGLSARGSLMRSEWGMEYGVANGLVGDEVELIIETEALREEGQG